MVVVEYINGSVVKIAGMSIIEEYQWIEFVCSTDCLEMHHCLNPDIPFHKSRWYIVDYPVFWDVLVNILGAFFCLGNYNS